MMETADLRLLYVLLQKYAREYMDVHTKQDKYQTILGTKYLVEDALKHRNAWTPDIANF